MTNGKPLSWILWMSFFFAVCAAAGGFCWNGVSRPEPGVVCPDRVWEEIGIDPRLQEVSPELLDQVVRQYSEHGCRRESQVDADEVVGWRPVNTTMLALLGALLGLAVALHIAERRAESDPDDDLATVA